MASAKLRPVLLRRNSPFRRAISWALLPCAALALIAATEVRDSPNGKMAIIRPAGAPLGSIILIPGGSTDQTISDAGQPSNSGNFVMRVGRKFVDAGYAVAYVENPADLRTPIAAMRAIARPVVFLATSNGTVVAVDNALALGKDGPDALVLTSTVTVPNLHFTHAVTALQASRLQAPTLFIHNTNDLCKVSRIGDARSVAAADKTATWVEVTSDPVPREDQCGPYAPHGYAGIESDVVRQIVDWIASHASARIDS
jgi:hypothetical protein